MHTNARAPQCALHMRRGAASVDTGVSVGCVSQVSVAEECVSRRSVWCLANMRFTASAGIGKKPTPVAAGIESAR
jgi:hypothetical protein